MRYILFVAVTLLSLGCQKDPAGPAVFERWVLVRLNGLELPYVLLDAGPTKEEVLSGEIVLRQDGVFSDRTVFRTTQGTLKSTYSATLQGPYEITGTNYKFTVISEDDQTGTDIYNGTLVMDTLVVQVGTTNWKYVER